MLSENQPFIGSGALNITADIELPASISAVINFIELQFAAFILNLTGNYNTSEKALTDKLCKFLNRNAVGYPFFFQHENVESYSSGLSPQVDIGTVSYSTQLNIGDKSYGEFDSFFSIEAKRLPTPGAGREKEYIIGTNKSSGGIERFKKGIHGKGLRYAALVAYIQKEDFEYWLLTINGWIDELITSEGEFWKLEDKLKRELNTNSLARYKSTNYRIIGMQNDYINLVHFWLKMDDSNLIGLSKAGLA